MVRAYILGMQIECGCFGPGDMISGVTLLRDGALLAAAVGLTWMSRRPAVSAPPPTESKSSDAPFHERSEA
jgi:hypothetical protein